MTHTTTVFKDKPALIKRVVKGDVKVYHLEAQKLILRVESVESAPRILKFLTIELPYSVTDELEVDQYGSFVLQSDARPVS